MPRHATRSKLKRERKATQAEIDEGMVVVVAPPAPPPLQCPQRIVLFRHAERPTDEPDVNLSERGCSRAAALPPLYFTLFGKPDRIYACHPDTASSRPYQTAVPLAVAFDLPVLTPHSHTQYAALASDILTIQR